MAAPAATPLNLIGLCAGVGMLDEGVRAGLEHLGFAPRVLAYVERESYAAATLLARMEDESLEPAPVWCGDLERLDCSLFAGRVDGVVAGFPCQPWSVAGAKQGTDDARWIFPAIVDIVRRTGAWLVVFENVPGLVSGGGLDPVLGALAEERFDAEWLSLRAAEVGASHQRQRVLIAGVCRDLRHRLRVGHTGLQFVDLQQRSHGHEHPRAGVSLEDATRVSGGQWAGRERVLQVGQAVGNTSLEPKREPNDKDCAESRQWSRAGACGAGGELADAGRTGDQRRRGTVVVPCQTAAAEGEGDQRQRHGYAAGDGCEDVADGYGAGLSRGGGYRDDAIRRQEPDGHAGLACRELFALGPGDRRWGNIIASRPGLAPAVEPGLCVLADGMALVVDEARADQLRCGGNGVVPLWAAVATVIACRRLMA